MAWAPGLCETDVLRSIIWTFRISGTPGTSLNVTEVLKSLKVTITATYYTYEHKHTHISVFAQSDGNILVACCLVKVKMLTCFGKARLCELSL